MKNSCEGKGLPVTKEFGLCMTLLYDDANFSCGPAASNFS